MLHATSVETGGLRRTEGGRLRSSTALAELLAEMDSVLTDLEELNLRAVELAPAAVRGRALVLAAEAMAPIAYDAPETVMGLMDLVYDAMAIVLELRRSLPSADRASARGRSRDGER